MNRNTTITIRPDKAYPISNHLYGIFLEDIGFSVDGGLNANMVNNYSFDGVYMNLKTKGAVFDPLRYWEFQNGDLINMETDGIEGRSSSYARLYTTANARLINLGYHSGQKGPRPAMNIRKSSSYTFSCWVRTSDYKGRLNISVLDKSGQPLTTSVQLEEFSSDWSYCSASLQGIASDYGMLCITFDEAGTIDLDCIELYDDDYWNAGDPKWCHGKLRRDLVEALASLKPAFMRFPGGCIVEGITKGNEYNWKDTVGELWERKSNFSLWGEKMPDGGYSQSYQIGFYEYFCLCEDLKMRPLPTLSAGLNCQIREYTNKLKDLHVDPDSPEFESYIIQNYLDLIDFAKGDPEQNEWAALRAAMGHPKPFRLDMIGIGNENFGEGYFTRFEKIYRAVHAKDPDIQCIICNGCLPHNFAIKKIWNKVRANYPELIVDEHSYESPRWFEKQHNRYDNYPRNNATVYVGEYSANGLMALKKMTVENSNCLDSALGEAAFMTGMERNGDVVEMSSFAPLLNLVDSENWYSNLIDFNPKAVCLSVNYYVQKIFRDYYGPEYIPFDGKLPKHVYMSVTEDNSYFYLKLVNTAAVEWQIRLHGFPAGHKAVPGVILQHDNLDVKNKLDFHGIPDYTVIPQSKRYQLTEEGLDVPLKGHCIAAIKIKKI